MAKRPNILKLATKISLESMTYMGITYDDPEYKILEPIIDDDMCAIMMHVRLETNRTVEEVAKRARKSVEFTQEQLDKLCKTGAVRYRYVDGKRCYFYPIWVPGIMEGILANREQCDKYPVLGESFEAYTRRRPEMLAPVGGFGGLFQIDLSKYREPVLVSSIDGVGTKLMIAMMMEKYDTVGHDIVNHCIDDIAVQGAEPLYFMDYIGIGKLRSPLYEEVLTGIADACKAANCAILGGETAEMPGMYGNDFDLVGVITGVVEKSKLITGEKIRPGHVAIGFGSSGLHTNGFSLARKILFSQCSYNVHTYLDELGETVGEALLRPHICYYPAIREAQAKNLPLDGIAHITGGGLYDNVPRILPNDVTAVFDTDVLPIPPIFKVLVEKGLDDPLELNCSVLGYDGKAQASEIEMPVSGGELLTFMDKYMAGSSTKGMASLKRVLPAPIEPELRDKIRALSLDIFNDMDCKGVVRIDYMYDAASDGLYITEINTIPGSLAFYLWEAGGMPYSRLIDEMVRCAMEAQKDKDDSNYAYSSDILSNISLGGKAGSKAGLKNA